MKPAATPRGGSVGTRTRRRRRPPQAVAKCSRGGPGRLDAYPGSVASRSYATANDTAPAVLRAGTRCRRASRFVRRFVDHRAIRPRCPVSGRPFLDRLENGAGLGPGRERSIGLVPPLGENLVGHSKAGSLAGGRERAPRESVKTQGGIHIAHGSRAWRRRDRGRPQHVVEGAVRIHVARPRPRQADRGEGADCRSRGRTPRRVGRRFASTEPLSIPKRRVGPTATKTSRHRATVRRMDSNRRPWPPHAMLAGDPPTRAASSPHPSPMSQVKSIALRTMEPLLYGCGSWQGGCVVRKRRRRPARVSPARSEGSRRGGVARGAAGPPTDVADPRIAAHGLGVGKEHNGGAAGGSCIVPAATGRTHGRPVAQGTSDAPPSRSACRLLSAETVHSCSKSDEGVAAHPPREYAGHRGRIEDDVGARIDETTARTRIVGDDTISSRASVSRPPPSTPADNSPPKPREGPCWRSHHGGDADSAVDRQIGTASALAKPSTTRHPRQIYGRQSAERPRPPSRRHRLR